MNRRNFITLSGTSLIVISGICYLLSDKRNFVRSDIGDNLRSKIPIKEDERQILYLASLAPSGHNTQPWTINYLEPYHWIICNNKKNWLPAVDPNQRETILSIGAFLQNMEYAAGNAGYSCQFTVLALSNQDTNLVDVKLSKTNIPALFNIQTILERRTIRKGYSNEKIKPNDLAYITRNEPEFIEYLSNETKEHLWLNEQTIEANRIQAYRTDAETELAKWIRFSTKDAKINCDGLTLASMEIDGITGWYLRNFYGQEDVMKNSFRDKSVESVKKQVANSGGWILISSKDDSVGELLETGKLFQRILLKIRDKNIGIHPMTQILEEPIIRKAFHATIGKGKNVQFILRTGYLSNYPMPVSTRRPVDWFVN